MNRKRAGTDARRPPSKSLAATQGVNGGLGSRNAARARSNVGAAAGNRVQFLITQSLDLKIVNLRQIFLAHLTDSFQL
jgi:hypothetical protein